MKEKKIRLQHKLPWNWSLGLDLPETGIVAGMILCEREKSLTHLSNLARGKSHVKIHMHSPMTATTKRFHPAALTGLFV